MISTFYFFLQNVGPSQPYTSFFIALVLGSGPIKKESRLWRLKLFVGVAGFEPTASCSQSRRDTGLRYTPKK